MNIVVSLPKLVHKLLGRRRRLRLFFAFLLPAIAVILAAHCGLSAFFFLIQLFHGRVCLLQLPLDGGNALDMAGPDARLELAHFFGDRPEHLKVAQTDRPKTNMAMSILYP